jgi:hypothetical protein
MGGEGFCITILQQFLLTIEPRRFYALDLKQENSNKTWDGETHVFKCNALNFDHEEKKAKINQKTGGVVNAHPVFFCKLI